MAYDRMGESLSEQVLEIFEESGRVSVTENYMPIGDRRKRVSETNLDHTEFDMARGPGGEPVTLPRAPNDDLARENRYNDTPDYD